MPENGDAVIGLLPKALPAEMFGIAPAHCARVDRRFVPQALATFDMPNLLSGDHAKVGWRLYILADRWEPSPLRYFAGQVEGKPGWRITQLPCSHQVRVGLPQELAAALMTLA